MSRRDVLPVALLSAAFLLPWVLIGRSGPLSHGGVGPFLMRYFAAAGVYLAALCWIARRPDPARLSRRGLILVVVAGVLARVALLGADPSLSQDAWRYRWEGQVQAAGANPYRTPPADPSLAHLRDGGWLKVNHPEVPAIYGPPLELAFRALAALPGSLLPFKLAFLAADLALMLLILAALRRRKASLAWLLVYAWHPLAILEGAGQAHLETIPVALLALAIELEERRRGRWGALALGAAIAAKYLPLLLLPAFLLRARGWRERALRLLLVGAPGALCLLPFLSAGSGLGQGLSAYGRGWRFNDGGFWLLDAACKASGATAWFCREVVARFVAVPEGFDPALHTTWQLYLPKLLAGALACLIVGLATRPRPSEEGEARIDLRRVALAAGAAFLLLSPTVHPWYALWLLPFLPTTRGPGRAGLLYVTLALPLAYEVLLGYSGLPGSWKPAPWVRPAIWLPALALCLAPLAERRVGEPGGASVAA